jgi:hypothetical protein
LALKYYAIALGASLVWFEGAQARGRGGVGGYCLVTLYYGHGEMGSKGTARQGGFVFD